MTVTATVLADSINSAGNRLTTFELFYPWFIHPEFMTHRVFSRGAASSRAIPIAQFIEMIRKDTAMPVRWGLNGKGMQDHGEMSEAGAKAAKRVWLQARDNAILHASKLMGLQEPAHKQIANRLLMPFAHIRVVCSATSYANFFALRRHPAAAPEIHALADAMWQGYSASKPVLLLPGAWHLPYIQQHERDAALLSEEPAEAMQRLIRVSVARCARTSYRTHRDRVSTLQEDEELYQRLVGAAPLHASPAEHQATPDAWSAPFDPVTRKVTRRWDHPELHGNFTGWIQHRKTLLGETINVYNPEN